MRFPFVAGVCRFCKCSDSDACHLANGDTCGWLDANRTVCNAPRCARAWYAQLAAKKHARQKKTPAEVNALIRSKGRKPRARKAGAA